MHGTRQHKDREISPRTKRNFWMAKSRTLINTSRVLLEVNLWTDETRIFPRLEWEKWAPWWNFQTIILHLPIRFYWLRFGAALIFFKPKPEREDNGNSEGRDQESDN